MIKSKIKNWDLTPFPIAPFQTHGLAPSRSLASLGAWDVNGCMLKGWSPD